MTDTHTAPSQALIDAHERVIAARSKHEHEAASFAALKAEFFARHAPLIERVATLKRVSDAAEADLKALALAEHRRSGSTRPVDGVLIKMFKVPQYSETEAQAWSRESLPGLFEVVETWNRAAFEQLIKTGYPNIPGALVDEPRPEISKKLTPLEQHVERVESIGEIAASLKSLADDPFDRKDASE